MKFLLYSGFGEGSNILLRIQSEGNECGLYIDDKVYKDVFDGILNKVDNPDSFIDKDTIVIFDMSGFGKYADELRSKGHHVYGASKFADDLEHDRNFGFRVMSESGIAIPKYAEFTDFSDGIRYVKDHKTRLVFKPNGDMPCKLTYVSDNEEQLIEYLKFVDKRFGKDIESFILQDFVEGHVVSSEFFCSQGEFMWPPNHTVEVKKSMNDDLGPSTGCSGNIAWNSTDDIIKNGVFKVRKFIQDNKYTGQIDLNAVVNKEGVYGLEWTPRFGYDATPTYLSLIDGELGKFFSDMAKGQSDGVISSSKEYAGSIRITIPPYPIEVDAKVDTEKVSPNEGLPIQGWEKDEDSIYFYEVRLDDGVLVHSSGTGVVCLALDTGSSPEKCLAKPYQIAENLKVPDKQYRTDLNKVLPKMVKEIEDYGR